jgi:hypothetical protein
MPHAWWRRCASPDRLELVTETMRAALEALAAAALRWLTAMAPADWPRRYSQRASDWRLPQPKAARAPLAVTSVLWVGVLDAVHAADAPPWLRQVPAVQTRGRSGFLTLACCLICCLHERVRQHRRGCARG